MARFRLAHPSQDQMQTPTPATFIVGVGQTEFTRHGGIMDRSQFQVAAEAILAALADAGLTPKDVDGFASYSNDANEASLMQVALGVPQVRWSSMVWGGGGGGRAGLLHRRPQRSRPDMLRQLSSTVVCVRDRAGGLVVSAKVAPTAISCIHSACSRQHKCWRFR